MGPPANNVLMEVAFKAWLNRTTAFLSSGKTGAFSGGIPRLKTGTWGTRLLKDIEVRGNPTLDANRAFRMGHPRFFLR